MALAATAAKAEANVDIEGKGLFVNVAVSIPTDTGSYAQGTETAYAPRPGRPRPWDRCPGPDDAHIALRSAQAPSVAPSEPGLHGVTASGARSARCAVGAYPGVMANAQPGDRPCW